MVDGLFLDLLWFALSMCRSSCTCSKSYSCLEKMHYSSTSPLIMKNGISNKHSYQVFQKHQNYLQLGIIWWILDAKALFCGDVQSHFRLEVHFEYVFSKFSLLLQFELWLIVIRRKNIKQTDRILNSKSRRFFFFFLLNAQRYEHITGIKLLL